MYAVIKTGGQQYRVAAGEKIKVEQIPADVGSEITIDQVFMVGEGEAVQIGTPVVAGAIVKATVVSHGVTTRSRFSRCAAASTTRSTRGIVRTTPSFASKRSRPKA